MKKYHENAGRSFGASLRSAMAVLPVLLLYAVSLRGQVADPAFFINEAHNWWDTSVYRYATYLGDMPVEPVWSGAEVAEAPDGTHLIVLAINGGPELRLSDGWHATAQQPNGGARLVLKRFSPTQIFPLLFFVYGYSDYVTAVGPAAVYARNKPHSLDTTFTGEAFYMYPGLFPGDTMRLVNGIGVQNGGIAKEFYPAETASGGVGYRCCVTTGSYESGVIINSGGNEYFIPEITITEDCSGCSEYWMHIILNPSGGTGSNPNNMNWSPEHFIGNNGGSGAPSGDPNGDTKVNPKLNGALCPDGSPKPPTGCKCEDGSPMPADGDCGEDEGPCQLTNLDVGRIGATVWFWEPPLIPLPIDVGTRLVGRLIDCDDGEATYKTLISNIPLGKTVDILDQYASVVENKKRGTPTTRLRAWFQVVDHHVRLRLGVVFLELSFYWDDIGELDALGYVFYFN